MEMKCPMCKVESKYFICRKCANIFFYPFRSLYQAINIENQNISNHIDKLTKNEILQQKQRIKLIKNRMFSYMTRIDQLKKKIAKKEMIRNRFSEYLKQRRSQTEMNLSKITTMSNNVIDDHLNLVTQMNKENSIKENITSVRRFLIYRSLHYLNINSIFHEYSAGDSFEFCSIVIPSKINLIEVVVISKEENRIAWNDTHLWYDKHPKIDNSYFSTPAPSITTTTTNSHPRAIPLVSCGPTISRSQQLKLNNSIIRDPYKVYEDQCLGASLRTSSHSFSDFTRLLELRNASLVDGGYGEDELGIIDEEDEEIFGYLTIKGDPKRFTWQHCNFLAYSISLFCHLFHLISQYSTIPLPYPIFQTTKGFVVYSSDNVRHPLALNKSKEAIQEFETGVTLLHKDLTYLAYIMGYKIPLYEEKNVILPINYLIDSPNVGMSPSPRGKIDNSESEGELFKQIDCLTLSPSATLTELFDEEHFQPQIPNLSTSTLI